MTYRATEFCEGFEFGATIVGNNPNKPIETSAGTISIQSTTKRSGSYALKVAPANGTATYADFEYQGPVSSDNIGRFYIRFATLPDADCWLFVLFQRSGGVVTHGFAYNASTGKIRPGVHDQAATPDVEEFGSDGSISVSTGVWYRIDFKQTKASNVFTIDWQMAVEGASGTAETQFVSGTRSASTGASMVEFGDFYNTTPDGEFYFDDVVVLAGAGATNWPTYPIGDGRVVRLKPSSDGTHVNSGDFTDDAANSPPASVYDRIDDDPVTDSTAGDHIYQDTIGATSYLEVNLGDTPSDWASGDYAHGASIMLGVSQPSTGVTHFDTVLRDTVNSWSDTYGGGGSAYTGKFWEKSVYDPYLSSEANNSKAVWDAMVVRLGYADDVTPNFLVHDLVLQVAYPAGLGGNDGWGWGDGTERWHYL